jgi:hypothetical protein
MCIVIDINTLSMVFNPSNLRHPEFVPVKNWIDTGGGFLVFGGTKYKAELAGTVRYLRLVRLLYEAGKAIAICDCAVDDIEKAVCQKLNGSKCDDPHIIALLGASRCSLLCSVDSRSFEFIKDRDLYPKKSPRVRIYKSSRNASLLTKSNPSKLVNVDG